MKGNKLQKYIKDSILVEENEFLNLRMSKELFSKYQSGIYTEALKNWISYIKKVQDIGIKYPANANPKFYIYIVPTEDFIELLSFPMQYKEFKGGGKPVSSYDLDSFNAAYGTSSNFLENKKEESAVVIANHIHELAHLVHSMFFTNKGTVLEEGFADAFVFYTMGYEDIVNEHKICISSLTRNMILTAEELIRLEKENQFLNSSFIENALAKSCSFQKSYVSSYLLVRGMIEAIEKNFSLDKKAATQKFLEIVRTTNSWNEYLIFELADAIGLEREELLSGKSIQMAIISKIKEGTK